jgi:hypothetical protein
MKRKHMKAKPEARTSPGPDAEPRSEKDDLWDIDYDELDAAARKDLEGIVSPERAKNFKSLFQMFREHKAAGQRETES